MIRDNLPPYVADSPDMADLLQAEQPEISQLEINAEAMLREFFVDTVTVRTVGHWETQLGFDHPAGWPIDRRISRVKARLMASSPVTPAMLKEVIERVGGVECEIVERPGDPSATVKFVGQMGIPLYLDDIMDEVDTIRPGHVPVDYEYSFAALNSYEAYTLEGLAQYTLEDLALGTPLRGGDAS